MKNNKSLLLLFIVLAVASVFFIYNNKFSTVKEELKDFAVNDTAAITKIFLADRAGNTVVLEKDEKNNWRLNGKYEPRRSNIVNLLEVITKIDIRTKVAKAAYNNVIKSLASSAIKCEIYLNRNEKPERVYYVGGQTEDALGTFMIIENSNVPFITHIPGFNGYLTPRYSTDETSWRSPLLFSFQPEQVSSLKLEYGNFPENSFLLTQDKGIKKVSSPDGNDPIQHADSIAIDNYLSLFSSVYYESIVTKLSKNSVDSMLSSPPSIRLTINNGDEIKELNIYPMPISKNSLTQSDSLGKALKFDLDRVYGYLKPDNLLVLIQQQTINKLFRRKNDFEVGYSNQAAVKQR